MDVKTFRASSLKEALHLVRQSLGPEATVVSTEKRPTGLWGRLIGRHDVEVTAVSAGRLGVTAPTQQEVREQEVAVNSPSLQTDMPQSLGPESSPAGNAPNRIGQSIDLDERANFEQAMLGRDSYRERFRQYAAQEQTASLLEEMIQQHEQSRSSRLPSSLFRLFTELIDADVEDRFARELVEELQRNSTPAELSRSDLLRERAVSSLTQRIAVTEPMETNVSGRRVVALIGPTGVGKTTTIAKLAANLRLRDKRRVGLITVDTYRIAAVDQLRAYADIIDLPMEVVTTPREMRSAVATLSDMDIVLIDTAGRSPHDEIQIQELKAMLSEARADEVHLVLSSVSNARHMTRLVHQFGAVGPTSLLITKLDEAVTYGHLLPLLCNGGLPVSYTTHGQNVPDDIQPADPQRVVETILPV